MIDRRAFLQRLGLGVAGAAALTIPGASAMTDDMLASVAATYDPDLADRLGVTPSGEWSTMRLRSGPVTLRVPSSGPYDREVWDDFDHAFPPLGSSTTIVGRRKDGASHRWCVRASEMIEAAHGAQGDMAILPYPWPDKLALVFDPNFTAHKITLTGVSDVRI